jgi:cardiolipin synthase A/B
LHRLLALTARAPLQRERQGLAGQIGPRGRSHSGQKVAHKQPMNHAGSRHPRVVLGLKIALAAVIVTATLLAIAQDQQTVEVRSTISFEEPGAGEYLAALVGADLVTGNTYEVLDNGDQVFPAMLQAVGDAHQRISFETYVWDKGTVAERFTDALEKAARRGVKVNVIVDALGGGRMETSHVKRLQNAGCHVVTFNPSSWYTLEEVNYRTHRKILVVDGAVAFTGGVGVADQWQGNGEDAQHWRDTQVRIRGSIVRLLEAAFYENLIGNGAAVTPELSAPIAASGADDQSMAVRSSPSGGASDLKRLYLLALAMARRSVAITSPYFVTDESTMWALQDARKRGVAIKILVESDITDSKAVKYASRAAYDDLLQIGIEIHEYTPTMMHTKTMVVDGVLSIFGSANFDNRSLELNDELNVAVLSRGLAARFLQDFENDLRRSRQLTPDAWRERPLMERAHEYFWSYFDEVF